MNSWQLFPRKLYSGITEEFTGSWICENSRISSRGKGVKRKRGGLGRKKMHQINIELLFIINYFVKNLTSWNEVLAENEMETLSLWQSEPTSERRERFSYKST